MSLISRALPVAVLLGAVALATASQAAASGGPCSASLTPQPPSYETCRTVGGGTIASGSNAVTYGATDTGIACVSGSSSFDIFDQGAYEINAIRYYDQNGDLTRRVIHYDEPSGQWSNPLTATALGYTQRYVQTDVLAVPGDLTSSTETVTGENLMRPPTGAPVLFGMGRQVYNFDQSELFFSAGRNDYVEAFFEGDPAPLARVCGALTGS